MNQAEPSSSHRKSSLLKKWSRRLQRAVPYYGLCLYEIQGWPIPFSLTFAVNYSGPKLCNLPQVNRQKLRRFSRVLARSPHLRGQVFTANDLIRLRPKAGNEVRSALQDLGLLLSRQPNLGPRLVVFTGGRFFIYGFLVLYRRPQKTREFQTRDKQRLLKFLPELEMILEQENERLRKTDPAAWLNRFFLVSGLSRREIEVLWLALEGLSMKEMAEKLSVDMVTVRDHLKHIYPKLGVSTRPALMALILRSFNLLPRKRNHFASSPG